MDNHFNTGDLDSVEMEQGGGGALPQGDYPVRITKAEFRTNQPPKDSIAVKGWTKLNVEYTVANGKFEGKKMYADYNWSAPTDAEGNPVPSQHSIDKWAADGLDTEDATKKALAGIATAVNIGKQDVLKLMNAAGFIRMKDTKPGDSNLKRIASGQAVGMISTENGYEIVDDSGTSTGTIFEIPMLVTRVVMCRTKPVEKKKTLGDGSTTTRTFQEVKTVWDADPAKIGDLAAATPF